MNEKYISKLYEDGILGSFDLESYETCESCLRSKMTKSPFNKKGQRTSDLLGLVHTDVCEPLNTSVKGCYSYFVTFTDDFSRYDYVYLMRYKFETFEKFKEFKNKVQNQLRNLRFLTSLRDMDFS